MLVLALTAALAVTGAVDDRVDERACVPEAAVQALPPHGVTARPARRVVPGGRDSSGAARPRLAPSRDDPWLGPDKVKHFFTSAFVQGSAYGGLRATNLGHGSSVLGASLATAAVGVGKELRDRRAGSHFSLRDVAWNTAGAAAVTLLLGRTRR